MRGDLSATVPAPCLLACCQTPCCDGHQFQPSGTVNPKLNVLFYNWPWSWWKRTKTVTLYEENKKEGLSLRRMLPEFLSILEHIYIVIENGHFGSFIYSCWASRFFSLCVCVAFGVRMMNGLLAFSGHQRIRHIWVIWKMHIEGLI